MVWGKSQDERWSRVAIIKHILHLCLYVSILVCCLFTPGTGPFTQGPAPIVDTLNASNTNFPAPPSPPPLRAKRSLFNREGGGGLFIYPGARVSGVQEYDETVDNMITPSYGLLWYVLLYALRCLNIIALPLMIFHFFGLVLYPAFPDPPKQAPPLPSTTTPSHTIKNGPFICFRVVTRGTFPHLVRRNVGRNLATCLASGLFMDNFVIQVVSDRPLGLLHQAQPPRSPPRFRSPRVHDTTTTEVLKVEGETERGELPAASMQANSHLIRELVVPDEYKTPRGSLFKARALQYALEDENHFLHNYHDWIVHLDEETLLTPDSVVGICNFVNNDSHDFGQGLITYANDGVVNWLTTLADTFRVADDMGKLRFQLKCLHAPLFNWKGSYVVTRAAAERIVSFDVGPHGSIAEDCYFAMAAIVYQKGVTTTHPPPTPPPSTPPSLHHLALDLDCVEDNRVAFEIPGADVDMFHNKSSPFYDRLNFRFDFIEGEMWEKSPFTVCDFLKQRKRWLQGIYLVVHRCPEIPMWTSKLCLTLFVYAWILMPVIVIETVLINRLWPVPTPALLRTVSAFISGTTIYMYVFGALKSFGSRCWESSSSNNYTTTGCKDPILSSPHLFTNPGKGRRKGSKPARRSRRMRRMFKALSLRLRTSSCVCCCANNRRYRRRAYASLTTPGQEEICVRDTRCAKSPFHFLTGCFKCGLCVLGALAVIPFNVVIEVIAVVWGLFGNKNKFYIVSKQTGQEEDTPS